MKTAEFVARTVERFATAAGRTGLLVDGIPQPPMRGTPAQQHLAKAVDHLLQILPDKTPMLTYTAWKEPVLVVPAFLLGLGLDAIELVTAPVGAGRELARAAGAAFDWTANDQKE